MIDDGSTQPCRPDEIPQAFATIQRLDVLVLRRNLGHQRAIAVGLAFIDAQLECTAVVVMDGDGEDAPEDIPKLLARFDDHPQAPASSSPRRARRRSEGLTSRAFARSPIVGSC